MSTLGKKIYVLKPYKSTAKPKASNRIRTSKEFLDTPAPDVVFEGRSFCFTGVFIFGDGDRNQCEAAVRARGGCCYERPAHDLNYLVVGSFVEPAWAHQRFGRKIEAALELKSHGSNCKIISEARWKKFLQSTPELPQERQTPIEGRSKGNQLMQIQRDLDQLRKNQRLLVDALKKELSPSNYRRLVEASARSWIGHLSCATSPSRRDEPKIARRFNAGSQA